MGLNDQTNTVEEADILKVLQNFQSQIKGLEKRLLSIATGFQPNVYEALANGATNMEFDTHSVVKVTPTGNATYTTTVPRAGIEVTLIILTSGASSYTITFGTGFKSTGTLATGVTTSRVFVVKFISDGTNLYEVSRTVAMVA